MSNPLFCPPINLFYALKISLFLYVGDFIAILLDRAYGDRISLSPKGGGESSKTLGAIFSKLLQISSLNFKIKGVLVKYRFLLNKKSKKCLTRFFYKKGEVFDKIFFYKKGELVQICNFLTFYIVLLFSPFRIFENTKLKFSLVCLLVPNQKIFGSCLLRPKRV